MNPQLAPNTLLVVDDNPDDFFAVERCLQEAGIGNPLHHCESAPEALALLAQAEAGGGLPALVLLDINMPGMKGTEMLERLRASETLASLPVIMLTSSNDDRDVLAAFQGRAHSYLQKPLEFPALLQALQRIRTHRIVLGLQPRPEGARR
ncbi:MAG TPA: response regulator [Nevskiaceae bacterium]|nr:response regulator [Nevskiaceae bacterium]